MWMQIVNIYHLQSFIQFFKAMSVEAQAHALTTPPNIIQYLEDFFTFFQNILVFSNLTSLFFFFLKYKIALENHE